MDARKTTAGTLRLAQRLEGSTVFLVHPLRAWSIYLGSVFLGGALVAPWLYWSAQAAASAWPLLEDLAHNPLHRFVNRSLLLLALAGLWPLLRHLDVRSWQEAGLPSPKGQGGRFGLGLALGFVSLAAVAVMGLSVGARHWVGDPTISGLVRHVLNAGLAAGTVGLLEELLFRGALFGTMRRRYGWEKALLLSSLVYAWLHFLQPARWTGPVGGASGMVVLGQMLHGFIELKTLVPGFFNLALAGAILGLAYQRTGNLYFSIGLHAGWVFWVKSYAFLTRESLGANTWLWGTSRLIDGWATIPLLAGVLWVTARLPAPPRTGAGP